MNVHKKIAGVPVWGWLIAAGGAIALGLWLRHRATASSSAGTNPVGDTSGQFTPGATADPSASGLDPGLAELLSNAQSAFTEAISQQGASSGLPGSSSAGGVADPFSDNTFTDPIFTSVASSSGSGAASTPFSTVRTANTTPIVAKPFFGSPNFNPPAGGGGGFGIGSGVFSSPTITRQQPATPSGGLGTSRVIAV